MSVTFGFATNGGLAFAPYFDVVALNLGAGGLALAPYFEDVALILGAGRAPAPHLGSGLSVELALAPAPPLRRFREPLARSGLNISVQSAC